MTLHSLIKRSERVVIDNSPAIMTAIGVVGSLTTAYLTGKASFRAALILEDERIARSIELTNTDDSPFEHTLKEKAELVWKLYIPAISVASITCVAIVMSNRVSTKRATAVATAYALSERAHDEYRTRVIEKLGKGKENEVRTEMAQARIDRATPSSLVMVDGDGLVMCHDAFSNQFFKSTVEDIRRAVNDINFQILHSDYASVSDLYDKINAEGLESNDASEQMGWNTDKKLEIADPFPTVLYKEKIPCLSLEFVSTPLPTPWRFV